MSGTLVVMADGSRKAIEDVEVGDRVLATDPKTSKTAPRRVTATHLSYDSKRPVTMTVDTDSKHGDDTGTVVPTGNHPSWADNQGRWIPAGNLNPAMTSAPPTAQQAAIIDTATSRGVLTVHNLTIAGTHT